MAALRVVTSGVRAVLFNAWRDRHRSFIRDWSVPSHGPGLRSAPVNVDGTAMARAFAARLLIFSEKQTVTRVECSTGGATHQVTLLFLMTDETVLRARDQSHTATE